MSTLPSSTASEEETSPTATGVAMDGGEASGASPSGVAVGVLVQPPVARVTRKHVTTKAHGKKDKDVEAPPEEEDEDDDNNNQEEQPLTFAENDTQREEELEDGVVRKMEVFEIDDGGGGGGIQRSKSEDTEDDDDLLDDDMEGLLEDPSITQTKKKKRRNSNQKMTEKAAQQTKQAMRAICCSCCSGQNKIGNTTVFWPSMYHKTGWGIMGPHYLGPPCVMTLLWSASYYFMQHALAKIGWITALICLLFTLTATYHFIDTAFRDPGIVKPLAAAATNTSFLKGPDDGQEDAQQQSPQRPPPPDRHHRWCDLCQAYQPPTGAHCPECNVCVEGYDHHCAWMGCCIGHLNYPQFMKFNMTWFLYLTYAVIWVSFLGPFVFRHQHQNSHGEDGVQEEQLATDVMDDSS